jgi:hypothetical protein
MQYTIGELSMRPITLFSDLTVIGGLHVKLCAPRVMGVLVVGILELPLGNLGQNAIWMWPPWRVAKNTIRGKVVVSPKSGP